MNIRFIVGACAIVAIAICSTARAQQPPEDGRITVYRQLLATANDNVAALGAQLQAVQIENARLKAEVEKAKAEGEKKAP